MRVKMAENLNVKGLEDTDFTESTFLPWTLPLCYIHFCHALRNPRNVYQWPDSFSDPSQKFPAHFLL